MKTFFSLSAILFLALPLSAAEPTTAAPPRPKDLTAADLYPEPKPDSDAAFDLESLLGRRVELDVVVKIAREQPLVEIVPPPEQAGRAWRVGAHLISVTTQASSLKQGERVRIRGMIVDHGYGAYMIYLHEAKPIEQKPPAPPEPLR
jgi:hypothetical protein